MLKTIDEIKNVEIEAGVVVNGVDNANLMSIDSTEPVKTVADTIDTPDTGVVVVEDKGKDKEKKEESEVKEKKPLEKSDAKEKEKEEEKKEKTEEKVDDEFTLKPDDSKKVQKRIGKLTKQWRTAERERDFEKEKRIELEEKLDKLSSKIPVEGKPLKVDFDDEDDFIEALTDWKIDNKLNSSQEKVVKKVKETEERDGMLNTYDGLDQLMDDGKEKYEDFNDLVLDEDLVLSSEVTQISLSTENPEDVIYYLASNPEESRRISKLDPIRSGMEIGKIEVKLLNKTEVKPKVKPKKQSKAPAPISSVRTDGIIEKDPNKMNAKEYRAWRESQR